MRKAGSTLTGQLEEAEPARATWMGLGQGCPISSHREAGGRAEASLLPRRAPARSAAPQVHVHEETGVWPVPSQGRQVLGLARQHGEPRKADQPKRPHGPLPPVGTHPKERRTAVQTHTYIGKSPAAQQPQLPSTDEWISKRGLCICTMAYYSAVERSDALPNATTWRNRENRMQQDSSQAPKVPSCVTPFVRKVQGGKTTDGKWFGGCQGLGTAPWTQGFPGGCKCLRTWPRW